MAIGLVSWGCSALVHAGDYRTLECATNQDCIDAHGANWICRKSNKTCQGLLTADCQTVLGGASLSDESTILYGATFALNGTNASVGRGELAALQIAYSEFGASANGLPPLPGSTRRRQVAVLVCDDSSSNDVALRSVTHLVKDLEVQAILGPTSSGPTIGFLTAPEGTVASGTLVIASGTTSPDLTTLTKGDPTLFYRTCESTDDEAPAIASLVNQLQTKLTDTTPLLDGKLKIALVYRGDSFGKSTSNLISQGITLNGKSALDPSNSSSFLFLDYGNPADSTGSPLRYDETIAKILALRPNIVIPVGGAEAFGSIMGPVEQQWPSGAPRPMWVYTHNGINGAIVSQIKLTDPANTLRKRIVGVTYGSLSTSFTQFLGTFGAAQSNSSLSPYSPGTANTYDAFYTLVYATVANGTEPLTGTNLSRAFAKLVPPAADLVNVGPADLNRALGLLSQGRAINIEGTTGALDFDLKTGDVKQENQVWCIPLAADGTTAFPSFSGFRFDLSQKQVGGVDLLASKCGVQFNGQ